MRNSNCPVLCTLYSHSDVCHANCPVLCTLYLNSNLCYSNCPVLCTHTGFVHYFPRKTIFIITDVLMNSWSDWLGLPDPASRADIYHSNLPCWYFTIVTPTGIRVWWPNFHCWIWNSVSLVTSPPVYTLRVSSVFYINKRDPVITTQSVTVYKERERGRELRGKTTLPTLK